jgi:hypothetical protein
MAGVFISFRPEDSAATAAQIYERLSRSLGRDHVILSVDNLAHGADFASRLTARLGESDAVVVVIGKNWLTRTLHDPNDHVRIEIEAALERGIRVIPVLVDGAVMPRTEDLPDGLKNLTHRNGIAISRTRFDFDLERLTHALSGREEEDRRREAGEAERAARQEREEREAAAAADWAQELAEAEAQRRTNEGSRPNKVAEAERFARGKREKEASQGAKTSGIVGGVGGPFLGVAAALGGVGAALGNVGAAFASAAWAWRAVTAFGKAGKFGADMRGLDAKAIKKTTRRAGAKEAARPRPAELDAASRAPRGAINQDLSVDEMKDFASARRADALPDADRPRVRSEAVQSASAPEDMVECSVFGPPSAPPGKTILIQVFLHLANQAERASFLATTMDSSAKLKGAKSLDVRIKRGARVEIVFSADGLVVDEPVQSVVWRGEPAYCQILATIPAGTSGQSFFPVIRVSVDGKLVGPIKFRLSSDDTASQPTSEPLGDHAGPYRYAFVSYASTDREEVLKRVQMLEVLKTKFFQDILSLDPGDRWEKKLYENIDRCDLFLLFWSQAAKDSQWVLREAEYALAHQRTNNGQEPDLVPVVLEQNVPPPENLSAFHFNDPISYLISRKL